MKNLNRKEEEAIKRIASVLDRMEELAIDRNGKKDKHPISRRNNYNRTRRQTTLLNKSSERIDLHLPIDSAPFK